MPSWSASRPSRDAFATSPRCCSSTGCASSRGCLAQLDYRFDAPAHEAFGRYIRLRRQQPHFANARSIRNALDRIRLRHATRLFGADEELTREQLSVLQAEDILASRVFNGAALPRKLDEEGD